MTCAEVKEKLIDFLYDELSPETHASFAQHLDGCPACKAEVASFQETLGSTRAALGGPLSQEPPMRVHLAVLDAAQAARPSTARKAPAPPSKHARPATSEDDGFFTRLLRSPWFLPAFGAASVATVVFLVRVLKNPEVLPGQQPHAIDESSVEPPRPAAAPLPVDKAIAAKPEGAASGKGSVAVLPPAEDSARLGIPARKHAAAIGTARRKAQGELGRGTDEEVPRLRERSHGQDGARFAEPPPPRPIPAAAPGPATVAATRAQDVAPPTHKRQLDGLDLEGMAAAKSSVASEKAAREVGKTPDESIRKADRLFASQDWNAAADAYRDLLRRFPRHKDVLRWRDRINASTAAYQQALEAKRKKAVSDDPLSGLKL